MTGGGCPWGGGGSETLLEIASPLSVSIIWFWHARGLQMLTRIIYALQKFDLQPEVNEIWLMQFSKEKLRADLVTYLGGEKVSGWWGAFILQSDGLAAKVTELRLAMRHFSSTEDIFQGLIQFSISDNFLKAQLMQVGESLWLLREVKVDLSEAFVYDFSCTNYRWN